jgi:hypothetical protein
MTRPVEVLSSDCSQGVSVFKNGGKHLPKVILLASLALASYVAVWVWLNIQADHPMEYRENAVLFTADLVSRGENPYALEHRPVYVNGFGMGYYWVSYPFVRLFGNSYLVLRAVSLTFLVATCALLAWAVRFDKGSRTFALIAALALFSQLGQGLSIVARPDSLGMFFLLAGLFIPYRFRFRPVALAIGAAMLILGYLTKPYFLVGLPLLVLYVFLFESKLRAFLFGLAAFIALGITVFAINAAYECYFTDTFFATAQQISRSWEHLLKNGTRFVVENLGFVLILIARFAFASKGVPDDKAVPAPEGINFARLRSPLLPMKMSFPGFILIGHSLALIFLLGLHKGNDILYYHQLISPFLLWIACWAADVKLLRYWPVSLVLLGNILSFAVLASPLPEDHSAEWRQLERRMALYTNVFAAPHVSHFLWRNGAPVYDNGHTEGLLGAFDRNITPVSNAYRARTDAFLLDIRSKVQNKEFDMIIACRGWAPLLPAEELKQHYTYIGLQAAPMTFDYWLKPHPLEVWVLR